MSGLWSFREARLDAEKGKSDGALNRQVSAVTRVLPVGVEYKHLLQFREKDFERSAAAAAINDAPFSRGEMNTDVCSTSPVTMNATTSSGGVSVDVFASSSCDTDARQNTAQSADMMSRDEAITEVQQRWWRTLDVDVRPTVELPCADSTTNTAVADDEVLGAAQALLARVAVLQHGDVDVGASPSLHCSSGGVPLSVKERNEGACPRAGDPVRRPPSTSPKTNRKNEVSSSYGNSGAPPKTPASPATKRTSARDAVAVASSSPSAVSRSAGLSSSTMKRMPLNRSHTATDLHEEQDGSSPNDASEDAPSSPPVKWAKEKAVVEDCEMHKKRSLRAGCEKEAAAQRMRDSSSTLSDSVLCSTVCSVPLQKALQDNAAAAAVCKHARRKDQKEKAEALRLRVDRLPLHRFYSIWVTAGENRHLQRSAASYHEYLLQCIRETLSEVSGTASNS